MNTETSFFADTSSEVKAVASDAELELKSAAPAYAPVVGVVAMMAVALPLVFALHSNPQAAQTPSQGNTPATTIDWNFSFDCARQFALSSGKMMMIVFTSETCLACQEMEREVFGRAPIVAESQHIVALKIDAALQPQIAARYGVEKWPTIVWTDAAGQEKHRAESGLNGYELYQAMQQFH